MYQVITDTFQRATAYITLFSPSLAFAPSLTESLQSCNRLESAIEGLARLLGRKTTERQNGHFATDYEISASQGQRP